MALQSWGHSAYWAVSSTEPPSTVVLQSGDVVSYPLWRPVAHHANGITLGSGFGGLQGLWDRTVRAAKVWACSDQDWRVIDLALDVTRSPIYQTARTAVRETAVKPGMRTHHCWNEIGRVAKAWNWSENVYRRLDANEAAERLLRAEGSTVTRMRRELAVELAYHELKADGR